MSEKQGLKDLLKDLIEENPLASEKELQRLFLSAVRGNEDFKNEAIELYFRNAVMN
jgi:hypothetical protein